MTAHEDLDRLLTSMLEGTAAPRPPDYLGEVFERTRRMRQRPAWSSPGRWLPMQLTLPRVAIPRAIPILIILALLLLAALAAALLIGSQRLPPPPFGLAATGQFAFDSNGDIFVSQPDGTGVRAITSDPTNEFGATWSRDGTRLAYWSSSNTLRTVPADLWVADADGANRRNLTGTFKATADAWAPAVSWSPDSRTVAFATAEGELYLVNSDGTGPPRLLGDDSLRRFEPTWSPDGTLIAFRGDQPGVPGIYVITPDGQSQRKVSDAVGAAGQNWSPDGRFIIYFAGEELAEPSGEILMASFDGTDWSETTLVGGPADDVWPRWSNDGTRLAFLRFEPGQAGRLFVADANGANVRLIADEQARLAFAYLCWTPDDRAIAALSGVPGTSIDGQQESAWKLIPLDGGASRIDLPAPYVSGINACSWQRLAP